jgi:hypothetical protein
MPSTPTESDRSRRTDTTNYIIAFPQSAFHSHSATLREQWGGKASVAMNEMFSGKTTQSRLVPAKTPFSMCASSESVSNEIDESDSQCEKHDEQIN